MCKYLLKQKLAVVCYRCVIDIYIVERRVDFISQTKYMAGLIHHDCKDTLSRIELLLSRLEEGESLNAEDVAAELMEARLEMYEVLRGAERIEELCEQELKSRS